MIRVNRPVVRETGHTDYRTRKPYVIRLEVGGRLVRVKVKGQRKWYTVTVEQIVAMGAMNLVQQKRAERKARRQARKENGAS